MATIEITYNGQPALTATLAAKRYGKTLDAMAHTLSRHRVEPLPERLDGKSRLYLTAALDVIMAELPGRGANFRKSHD